MKALILIFLSVVAAQGQRLTVPAETGLFTYERIEQLDTMSAKTVFTKAKEWVVLKSGKISGEIAPTMIKATFTAMCAGPMGSLDCTFDVVIRSKDGAIKVTIDRWIYQTNTSQIPLESQFGDPAAAIVKKKKAPVGLESIGDDFVAGLLKHMRAKSDF